MSQHVDDILNSESACPKCKHRIHHYPLDFLLVSGGYRNHCSVCAEPMERARQYRHAALYHNLEVAPYAVVLRPNTSYLVRPNLFSLNNMCLTPGDPPCRLLVPDEVEQDATDLMYVYCTGSNVQENGHIHECACPKIEASREQCQNSNLEAIQQLRWRRKQFLQVRDPSREQDQVQDRGQEQYQEQEEAHEPAVKASRKRRATEPLFKQATKRAAVQASKTSRDSERLPLHGVASHQVTPHELPSLPHSRYRASPNGQDQTSLDNPTELRADNTPTQLPATGGSVSPQTVLLRDPSEVLDSSDGHSYLYSGTALAAPVAQYISPCQAPSFFGQPPAVYPVSEPSHFFSATESGTSGCAFIDTSFAVGSEVSSFSEHTDQSNIPLSFF